MTDTPKPIPTEPEPFTYPAPYRQTFVVEYPSVKDAPRVYPSMPCMGGKLVAAQFSDAIEELQDLMDLKLPVVQTAESLNAAGVSCGTCPHWSRVAPRADKGICYHSGMFSGHGTTIDHFCSAHPKLRGEG